MPMTPIALTDEMMDSILRAAAPLRDRSAFLEDLARELGRLPEPLGNGSLHRVIMQVQRKHFDPPQGHSAAGSKYSNKQHR